MKAWLITWDWAGDSAALADRIAAILPWQWSDDRVTKHVEVLYALANSTVEELADYAKRPSNNPYRPKRDGPYITCGHNPYLVARVVTDLNVKRDGQGH